MMATSKSRIEKTEALDLVQKCFPRDWNNVTVGQVIVAPITGGLCNYVWKCSRTDEESTAHPRDVIIRKLGESGFTEGSTSNNCESLQAVIAFEFSRRNIGPKLFGIFSGGRIEEFIDGRTLSPGDCDDREVVKDVAIAVARVHSIRTLPIADRSLESHDGIKNNFEYFLEHEKENFLRNQALLNANVNVRKLLEFDLLTEYEWFRTLIVSKVKMRSVLSMIDMNFLNCIVRNEVKSDQLKVVLIDYDLVNFDYRGCEIASHFFNRTVNWSHPVCLLNGHPYPTEDEQVYFIEEYLKETKKLEYLEDFDEKITDSVEHVKMEVLVGSLSLHLFISSHFLRFHKTLPPQLVALVGHCQENYIRLKNKVVEQYGW